MTILPFQVVFSEDEIQKAVESYEQVLRSGWLILGKHTQELENKLSKIEGVEHVVCTSSGTSSLEIIFKALGTKKALCPTQTNFATAEALVRANARPVLYDGGLFPNIDCIQEAFELQPDCDTLVTVHLGGIITQYMDEIEVWCEERGVRLVMDSAHAHGCVSSTERKIASYGAASALSFFPTKVVTSFEGGAILTNSSSLAELCRVYRDQGKAQDGVTNIVHGNSWRMPEDHAALLSIQLDSLLRNNAYRLSLLNIYHQDMVSGFGYPMLEGFLPGSNGYKMVVENDSSNEVKSHLHNAGIVCGKGIYDIPLHKQPVFRDFVLEFQQFPIAEMFSKNHLCLPCWKGLSHDDIQFIVNTLKTF